MSSLGLHRIGEREHACYPLSLRPKHGTTLPEHWRRLPATTPAAGTSHATFRTTAVTSKDHLAVIYATLIRTSPVTWMLGIARCAAGWTAIMTSEDHSRVIHALNVGTLPILLALAVHRLCFEHAASTASISVLRRSASISNGTVGRRPALRAILMPREHQLVVIHAVWIRTLPVVGIGHGGTSASRAHHAPSNAVVRSSTSWTRGITRKHTPGGIDARRVRTPPIAGVGTSSTSATKHHAPSRVGFCGSASGTRLITCKNTPSCVDALRVRTPPVAWL